MYRLGMFEQKEEFHEHGKRNRCASAVVDAEYQR